MVEKLTIEERVEKIRELVGEDIAVIMNCNIQGEINVIDSDKRFVIENNIIT